MAPTLRPEWVTPALLPFESHFIEIDGHTVHYLDEGSGPALLMLHGNPTWSFVYRHLIQALRGRFRCVAIDYPGFGLSRAAPGYDFTPERHADVVEAFVKRLDLCDYTPIVQDWGGPIGLAVAGRMPERVRAMVILNTWAWPVDDDPHFVRFSGLMGGAVGAFAIRHFNAFVNVMIPMGTPRRKLPREAMSAYRKPFSTPDSRAPTSVFPRRIVASTAFLAEVERGLSKLADKPALFVWGDADIAFREKELQRFLKLLPNSESHVVKGAGHFMQEDAHEEIASSLLSWWRDP